MPPKTTKTIKTTETELQLVKEVKELSKEVRKLKNLEFVHILKRPWKFLWMAFLKGLMVGFGSVLGASVLVAIFIYIIAQIQVVPFLGDFVQDIVEEVKNVRPSVEESVEEPMKAE
jgi:hypothetical protein